MSETIDSFDGEVHGPPPLSDELLARVPARRGVALLCGEDDYPIQLLPAADMRARVRNRIHSPDEQTRRNMPDLGRITRKVSWKLAGGHFETDLCFLEISRRLWPEEYTGMLDWKPPWFVHVDPRAAVPQFVRTRRCGEEKGRYLGPFGGGKSAQRFCEILRDGFYLCRDVANLRNAPDGRRCAYGQMDRCQGACYGRISMDEYRRKVERAADFAVGRREGHLDELRRRMHEASKELNFERAAAFKARIDRLAELDEPDFQHVAPLDDFCFVLVQPHTARKAKVFYADCSSITGGEILAYPPSDEQLREVLRLGRERTGQTAGADEPDRWRMGLVCRYLFSSPRRRGVMLRLRGDLDVGDLREGVSASADDLGLRPPPSGTDK